MYSLKTEFYPVLIYMNEYSVTVLKVWCILCKLKWFVIHLDRLFGFLIFL